MSDMRWLSTILLSTHSLMLTTGILFIIIPDSTKAVAKAATLNCIQKAEIGAKGSATKPAEASTDHITYMSTEELAQLRNGSSSTEGLDRNRANTKRGRGGKVLGYSYDDDDDDDDNEEEEEEEGEVEEEEDEQDSRSNSSTGKRHKKHKNMDEESDEEEDELSAVHRMREEALDSQYEESESKLWAAIPAGTFCVD